MNVKTIYLKHILIFKVLNGGRGRNMTLNYQLKFFVLFCCGQLDIFYMQLMYYIQERNSAMKNTFSCSDCHLLLTEIKDGNHMMHNIFIEFLQTNKLGFYKTADFIWKPLYKLIHLYTYMVNTITSMT